MAKTADIFESLVDKFSDNPDVKRGNMFGFASITVLRKTFAVLDGDSMVFKLTGDVHASALALGGAVLWNPFGHQKKEWVQIPVAHAADWEAYAQVAKQYVRSLIEAAP